MNAGSRQRLKNLAAIFNMRPQSYEDEPDIALALLSHLYAMPLIRDKAKRRNYGNQILGNTRGHFDQYSEFVGRLGTHVIMMQEFPNWYANLGKPTSVLVEMYKDIERTVYYLNLAGFGAGATAAGAGLAEGIKTGSAKEGAKKLGTRLSGKGAVLEAIQGRVGTKISPRAAGVAGAIVIVAGSIAYASGVQQMEDIKEILMDRFQNGQMSKEQFTIVFGKDIDPSLVKKYWEM